MRIAISGSHGTGKTTLLEKIKPLNVISEIARTLIEKWGNPKDMTIPEREHFQSLCFYYQMNRELNLGDSFFSDRSFIDVLAYSYDLKIFDSLLVNVKSFLAVQPYDIVFYCPIEFPMEHDGVRPEDEEYRQVIQDRIIEIASRLGIELVEISGTLYEREKSVERHLGQLKIVREPYKGLRKE